MQEFEDPRDAEYAVRRMDGADVDGRRIIVEYARSRGPGAGGRGGGMGGTGENRVLVYGLGDRTSWQDLKVGPGFGGGTEFGLLCSVGDWRSGLNSEASRTRSPREGRKRKRNGKGLELGMERTEFGWDVPVG